MNVKIKNEIFDKLRLFQKDTSFKTPEELIEYIIEEYLNHNGIIEKQGREVKSDKEVLNERLKNLGYL